MKVLVVGGGGREHALCWKIAQSPEVTEVLCAPGNPGTAEIGRNCAVNANDVPGMVALAKAEGVGLVVIGPEDPLVAGMADKLRAEGFDVFGPDRKGAQLEGSKAFSKELLERHRIPTGMYRQFDRSGMAKSYLETVSEWPVVVKADGLAAGKGVFVCEDQKEACRAVDRIMEERTLGAAGERVVIEEFLVGEEVSVHAITDGQAILILEPVMDHKQVGEGDTGPNTGGMGVYSPVPTLSKRVLRQIEQRVLVPTIHALRREDIEFRGVLFAGLMITESGPRVLEFNVRFGDPETQAICRRLEADLVPYLRATAQGKLSDMDPPEWDSRSCVGVIAAAEGYPDAARKGDPIRGIQAAESREEVVVFQAGTAQDGAEVVTSGGRVLCVSAMGKGPGRGSLARLRGLRQHSMGRQVLPPRHRQAFASAARTRGPRSRRRPSSEARLKDDEPVRRHPDSQ